MKNAKIVASLIIGLLAGCDSAKENSIYRKAEFGSGSAVLIDAKQRAILSNQLTEQAETETGKKVTSSIHRYCAEPSPDAFSVLSSSISLSSALSQAEKVNLNLQLSRSISESGSNIGLRTQTITVLRDMMYRLCERYINKAITAEEFSIQAGRDQRIMVSVLAIEQLTAAIQPRTIIIGANSKASAGENIAAYQSLLDAARKDLKSAESELSKNQEILEVAKENKKSIEGKTTTASYSQSQKDADLIKANTAIRAAEEVIEIAKMKIKDREQNIAALESQLVASREINAASSVNGRAFPETARQENDISNVATAVRDIVRMTFETDEVTLACIKLLGKTDLVNKDSTSEDRRRVARFSEICQSYLEESLLTKQRNNNILQQQLIQKSRLTKSLN